MNNEEKILQMLTKLVDAVNQQGETLARHEELLVKQGEMLARHEELLVKQGEMLARHEELLVKQGETLDKHGGPLAEMKEDICELRETAVRARGGIIRKVVFG